MSGSLDGGALVQAYSNFAANQNKDPYATAKSAADLANIQQQTAASQQTQRNAALDQTSKQLGIQGAQSAAAAADSSQWTPQAFRSWIANGLQNGTIEPAYAAAYSKEADAAGNDPHAIQQLWLNHAHNAMAVKDQIDMMTGKLGYYQDGQGNQIPIRTPSDNEQITNPGQGPQRVAGTTINTGMTPAVAAGRQTIPGPDGKPVNVPTGPEGGMGGGTTNTDANGNPLPGQTSPVQPSQPSQPVAPNPNTTNGAAGGPPPKVAAPYRLNPTPNSGTGTSGTGTSGTGTSGTGTGTSAPARTAANTPAVTAPNPDDLKANITAYNDDRLAAPVHATQAGNLMLAHDALEVVNTGALTGDLAKIRNMALTVFRETGYPPPKGISLQAMSQAEAVKYLTGYAATAAGDSTDYGKQLAVLANANGDTDPQAARDIINKGIGMERLQLAANKYASTLPNFDKTNYITDRNDFLAENQKNYQAFAWDAYTNNERKAILTKLASITTAPGQPSALASFQKALGVAQRLSLVDINRQNHFKGGVTTNPAPSTTPGPIPPVSNGLAPPPPNPNGLSGQ